jgi:hypothetical protein
MCRACMGRLAFAWQAQREVDLGGGAFGGHDVDDEYDDGDTEV